jgi:3-oxoacyl-[acyl-carrier-protein] synthase II
VYEEKNDIWVTGIGIACSAGMSYTEVCASLKQERLCAESTQLSLPVPLWSICPEPVSKHPYFLDDRKSWLGLYAAEQAVQDAQEPSGVRSIFMGTGLSSITPQQLEEDLYPFIREGIFDRVAMARDLSTHKSAPARHAPNRLVEYLSQKYHATGPCGTSFSACAAASQAIAEGMRTLRRGEADVAIVGGHDSMAHPMGMLSFVVLGALSTTRCRPFDKKRDGFMLGEGSAVLVLERAEEAKKRGVRPYARLCGAGSSIDAWNVTAPHPEGLGAERSMRSALHDADLIAEDIGYINAHGTGTPLGDIAESAAISRVFGARTPVSSIKGALGHCIAAAGAIEAVVCIAALQHQFLPGTVGLETPEDFGIDIVQKARSTSISYTLSNSFGFGGQNSSLIFGAID